MSGAALSKRSGAAPPNRQRLQICPIATWAVDLAEAEIADTKQAYYDALSRRNRALRALAREREELSNA